MKVIWWDLEDKKLIFCLEIRCNKILVVIFLYLNCNWYKCYYELDLTTWQIFQFVSSATKLFQHKMEVWEMNLMKTMIYDTLYLPPKFHSLHWSECNWFGIQRTVARCKQLLQSLSCISKNVFVLSVSMDKR